MDKAEKEFEWQMIIGTIIMVLKQIFLVVLGVVTAGFVVCILFNKTWWAYHVAYPVFTASVYIAIGSLILGILLLVLPKTRAISISVFPLTWDISVIAMYAVTMGQLSVNSAHWAIWVLAFLPGVNTVLMLFVDVLGKDWKAVGSIAFWIGTYAIAYVLNVVAVGLTTAQAAKLESLEE
jgi:hypothetical protein